jgi:hypothetical protein
MDFKLVGIHFGSLSYQSLVPGCYQTPGAKQLRRNQFFA